VGANASQQAVRKTCDWYKTLARFVRNENCWNEDDPDAILTAGAASEGEGSRGLLPLPDTAAAGGAGGLSTEDTTGVCDMSTKPLLHSTKASVGTATPL
jgi:hypothetical protein